MIPYRTIVGTMVLFLVTSCLLPDRHPRLLPGHFRVTLYWVADEREYPGTREVSLLDPQGHVITTCTRSFAEALAMEGTGRLRDGRTLNMAGQDRYQITLSANGLGADGHPLIPFRSMAVDPKVIPLGTRLYAPDLKGMVLPDGALHDGVLIAHDTGKNIRGHHADLFIGEKINVRFVQSLTERVLDLYRLEP